MAKESDPGAAARAARLREQINDLKNPEMGRAKGEEPKTSESPREFIHRRMRELDKKDDE